MPCSLTSLRLFRFLIRLGKLTRPSDMASTWFSSHSFAQKMERRCTRERNIISISKKKNPRTFEDKRLFMFQQKHYQVFWDYWQVYDCKRTDIFLLLTIFSIPCNSFRVADNSVCPSWSLLHANVWFNLRFQTSEKEKLHRQLVWREKMGQEGHKQAYFRTFNTDMILM